MSQYHRIDHIGVTATKGTGEWIYSYPTIEEATLALLGSFLRAATAYNGNAEAMLGTSRSIQDSEGNIICLLAPDKEKQFILTAYPTSDTQDLIRYLDILHGRRAKDPSTFKRARNYNMGGFSAEQVLTVRPALQKPIDKYMETVSRQIIQSLPATVTIEALKDIEIAHTTQRITSHTDFSFADAQQARLAYVHYLDRLSCAPPNEYKEITGIAIRVEKSLEGFWHPGRDLRHSMTLLGGLIVRHSKPSDKLSTPNGYTVNFCGVLIDIKATRREPHPRGEKNDVFFCENLDQALQRLLSVPCEKYHRPTVAKQNLYFSIQRGWVANEKGETVAEIGTASQLKMTLPERQFNQDDPDNTVLFNVDPALKKLMINENASLYLMEQPSHVVGQVLEGDFQINSTFQLHKLEFLEHYFGHNQHQQVNENNRYEVYQYYSYDRAPEVAPFYLRQVVPTVWEALHVIRRPSTDGSLQVNVPQPFGGDTPGPTMQKAVIVECARQLPVATIDYKSDLSISQVAMAADLLPHTAVFDLLELGVPVADLRKPAHSVAVRPPATNYHLSKMHQRILGDHSADNGRKHGL